REAEKRIRHLHRALGSPRPRPAAEGRPDLQRRRGQRGRHRGAARARAGVQGAARGAAAEALDSVPVGDGRGEGAARLAVLRDEPAVSVNRTLANINMDGANQFGPTSDMETVGYGASSIDDIGAAVAKAQGREMKPE